MKKYISLILFFYSLSLLGYGTNASFYTEMDITSKYTKRGSIYTENKVFQNYIFANLENFKTSVLNVTGIGDSDGFKDSQIIETVLEFGYNGTLFNYSFITNLYDYKANTGEILLQFSKGIWGLSLYSNHYIGVIEKTSSYYGDIGLSYRYNLLASTYFLLKTQIDFGNGKEIKYIFEDYVKPAPSGGTQQELKDEIGIISTSVCGELYLRQFAAVYLKGYGCYQKVMNSDVKDKILEDKKLDTFFFGVSLGITSGYFDF